MNHKDPKRKRDSAPLPKAESLPNFKEKPLSGGDKGGEGENLSLEALTESLSNLILKDKVRGKEADSKPSAVESCEREVERLKVLRKQLRESPKEKLKKSEGESSSQKGNASGPKEKAALENLIEEKVKKYIHSSDFQKLLGELVRKEVPKGIQADLLKSKAGTISLIAERIRLECLELVSKPSFHRQLMNAALRETGLAEIKKLTKEIEEKAKELIKESIELLLDRIGVWIREFHRRLREVELQVQRDRFQTEGADSRLQEQVDRLKSSILKICEKEIQREILKLGMDLDTRLRHLSSAEHFLKLAGIPGSEANEDPYKRPGSQSFGPRTTTSRRFERIKRKLEAKGVL